MSAQNYSPSPVGTGDKAQQCDMCRIVQDISKLKNDVENLKATLEKQNEQYNNLAASVAEERAEFEKKNAKLQAQYDHLTASVAEERAAFKKEKAILIQRLTVLEESNRKTEVAKESFAYQPHSSLPGRERSRVWAYPTGSGSLFGSAATSSADNSSRAYPIESAYLIKSTTASSAYQPRSYLSGGKPSQVQKSSVIKSTNSPSSSVYQPRSSLFGDKPSQVQDFKAAIAREREMLRAESERLEAVNEKLKELRAREEELDKRYQESTEAEKKRQEALSPSYTFGKR